MQSEGPYSVDFEDGEYFILGFPFSRMLRFKAYEQFEAERINYWANKAYAAGRKAERERCAKIAEMSWCEEVVMGVYCKTGKFIAEKIRGGQDGE